MTVFVVQTDYGYDSVWSTKELAEERCKELNKYSSPKNPVAWYSDVEVDKN